MKLKLEIAAIITDREIFTNFFRLSWLENVFENTPSWVILGTYIQKNPYKLINFYTLNQ